MATGGGETNRLSDETFDLLCSLCKHKNKNTEAAKFCVDCQDYYCSTCVKFHEDIPALSGHKILDSGHFQPGTSQMLQMVPTERCDRHSHSHKHVDMYCQSHDDVGCSTCMAVEHKHCRDTFYIPDFLQNNKGTSASKVINQKLETTEKLLTDQHTNFKQAKKRLLKSKDVCLEEIKEYRKDINQRLDVLEQNSVKAVEAKYKPKLDKLDEQMANNQKTKVKISSAKDNLLNAGNNESQMFVSTKKGKNVADNAIKFIAETKEEIKGEDIKFITEPNLMSMLRELDLLGHLEEIDTWTQSKNECNNDSKTHQSTQSNSKKQAARATQNVVASYIETQSTDEHSNNSKTHQRSSKKQAASATQKAEESTTRLKSYDGYNNDSQKYQSTQSSIMQAVSATQKAEESATRLKSYDGYNNDSQKYQSTQSSSKKQAAGTTQKAEESATRLKSYDGYNNDSQKYQSTQSKMQTVSATQKAEESATRLKSYDGYNNDSQKYQSTQSKMQAVCATQTVSNALMNVKNKKKYNIRISSDKKECYIYSACDLDDGTIILADYGNSKLKRVYSSAYTVTDYCDVSGQLYQVRKISNQEVAVSCGGYIQFVSLGSKMVPTKQTKTDHPCYGLAYAAGRLYISDFRSVYIYTVSGSKLQKFYWNPSGRILFSATRRLAVSNDSSKIYVADRDYGLIALDRNGKLLGKYNGPELINAVDVCITNNGSVLVCGFGSKNVLQFTPDCKKIGEVLKCDAPCQTVCYDPRQSKLIVGCYRDNIDVYDVV